MKKIKLFCIPFAGGSASIYYQWKNYLNKNIEVYPIELAGRGRRFSEPFYNDFNEAVDDIFSIIKNEINDDSYSLFGHSMGSLIVYELYRRIVHNDFKQPVYIFLSGRYPPSIKRDKILHNLPDDEFLSEIKSYGGIPEEVFNHEQLLNISLRIIKSDYKILEGYKKKLYEKINFDTDVTVFGGVEDPCVTIDELYEWKNYSTGNFSVIEFEGGHFFINKKMKKLLEVINDILVKY